MIIIPAVVIVNGKIYEIGRPEEARCFKKGTLFMSMDTATFRGRRPYIWMIVGYLKCLTYATLNGTTTKNYIQDMEAGGMFCRLIDPLVSKP